MAILKPMTREEYVKKYGVEPFTTTTLPKEMTTPPQDDSFASKVGGFAKGLGVGFGKGAVESAVGLGQLAVKGLSMVPGPNVYRDMKQDTLQTGEDIKQTQLKPKNTAETIGKFGEQVAEFTIPGAKVAKAAKGLSRIPRLGASAATSGLVGAAQTGDVKGGAIAAGVDLIAPGASKVVAAPLRVMGRLLRGTGSALSGASSAQIKAILENPNAARQAVGQIKKAGGSALLRNEASSLVKGAGQIRKEASENFAKALESLPKEANVPLGLKGLKSKFTSTLRNFGVEVNPQKKTFEFLESPFVDSEEKVLKKVFDVIGNWKDTSPKGLEALAQKLGKFGKATTHKELNSVIGTLKNNVRSYLGERVPQAKEMVSKYHQEMELLDEFQKVFGKVQFKGAKEILNVSQKLEGLFNQKGLAPDVVDNFLERIGVESTGFRAGESARQIGELAERVNPIGINPYEAVRAFTSAIVPPKLVRDIAIYTGIPLKVMQEAATKLSPAGRAIFLRSVLSVVDEQNPTDNE